MKRCWVGRGYLWSFMKFSADAILFSAFINNCNASATSAAGNAGFVDIGNTEKDLDVIQKKRKGGKKAINKKTWMISEY